MQAVIEHIAQSVYSHQEYNKEHSRIYKIHKYWARKPWYIVEKYIKNYSMPGDLIMDPFCGSGCAGLEAVINGRNFIGQDLNPAALRISSATLENSIVISELESDFKTIEKKCKTVIMNLYTSETVCPKCGKPMYFKYVNIGPKFGHAYSGQIYCPVCKTKGKKRDLTETEVNTMHALKNLKISHWVPDVEFPQKFYKDRFSYKGILKVSDMYTHRNLYALSILLDSIKSLTNKPHRDILLLAFSNTVLHVSKLKGENVRPLGVNNYWIPDDYIEENVWFRFEDRFNIIVKAKIQQEKREKEKRENGITTGKWLIRKKSALEGMGCEYVDYFFTDPPYGEAIQYSELSYVWNAWFEDEYETDQEVIINPMQNKDASEFKQLLNTALEQIYTALKTDKYFTLCFQNKNYSIWEDVIEKCKELGLTLKDISIYDTYGSPFNKNWASFSPKSDIYVTFQKCKFPTDMLYSCEECIEDIIKEIAEYMDKNNIAKDNNKLYDFTIAYLIWSMYYNEVKINLSKFNIKKFAELSDKVLN